MNVTETVEGLERYPVNIRYPRYMRDSLEQLKLLPIVTPAGQHITLQAVADLRVEDGPPMIKSENARLNGWIYVDIAGVDLGALSLIHISEPTRPRRQSRMPSSA